jgi:hypothetical protein
MSCFLVYDLCFTSRRNFSHTDNSETSHISVSAAVQPGKQSLMFRVASDKFMQNMPCLAVTYVALSPKFVVYGRINSIKAPASGAGNVRQPKLMSQVWRVREVVFA